jgi:hypothetical protein
MPMRSAWRIALLCIGSLCILSHAVHAQDYKIKDAFLTYVPPTFTAKVSLSDAIAPNAVGDINSSNITIIALPSGLALLPLRTYLAQQSFKTIFIDLDPRQLPAASDQQVSICFKQLRFADAQGTTQTPVVKTGVCFTGSIDNEAQTRARMEQILKDLDAVPKESSERNIFASGFVTTASGSDSQGGLDLNLNSSDLGLPGLTANLHMEKTTTENGDPKHFDVGLNYRSTFLFHGHDISTIQDLQNSGKTKEAQGKLDTLSHAVWSGITFDFGSHFEAEAFTFNVTNFIGEGMAQIKSRVLPLIPVETGETSEDRTGFYKFHLIPGGLEIGQNLNKGNESMQAAGSGSTNPTNSIDWVARYKFGAGLTLFYRNLKTRWLFKRIELDAQFVGRYLFRNEIMFDQSTMMDISTTKGFKPWTQVGLNAFIADTASGRFGLKLSYNKGSLPPVFAPTNSFQFGLVFETADDTKKKQ